ncbi:MAG: RpoL/Rpb11 RNA polymerase subunit family protein [Candidatus Methanomethylophilaceae archaeon]|jgi:DNA-directed RNA polymerase subunit L
MKIYIVERTDNSVSLGLKNADVTIIQPLIDMLYKNPDVVLVRYMEEHPELEDRILFVQVSKGDPLTIVKESADGLSEYFAELLS